MLDFVDEIDCNMHDALCRYDYTLQGKQAVCDRVLVKGKRYNAIGAMCMNSVLDVYIKERTVDGEEFRYFIKLCLPPQELPFNGSTPRSVVVLNNVSIHHIQHATSFIEMGALVVLLPPYSPDFMQIEELFSKN